MRFASECCNLYPDLEQLRANLSRSLGVVPLRWYHSPEISSIESWEEGQVLNALLLSTADLL